VLVCRAGSQKSATGAEAGSACCRLAWFHRQSRTRVTRYPSDMSDAQWSVIDPLLPDPGSLGGEGRPEEWCRRDIVDAIFYVVDNGGKWRALPVDFPPWPTVYRYLATWAKRGITQRVLDGLRDRVRTAEGRAAEPSAAGPAFTSLIPALRNASAVTR
jgi:transposase